jgi:hypothetical protein
MQVSGILFRRRAQIVLVFQMPANANNVEIWRMATDENATRLVQHEMESGMHSEGEQESIHSDRAGRNQSRTSLQSSGIRERFRSLTDFITSHLPRFRRIALGHLGDEADTEEVGWQAQTDDVARNIREDELRRRVLKTQWTSAYANSE